MKFSSKTLSYSQQPKFFNKTQSILDHLCHIHLNKLDIEIIVYFKTLKKDELMIEMANYYTTYQGVYLGVIDAFFQLIQGKPLEAADRFPIKELDYYLRDQASLSAFSGYSQEIYEILSIGESMKNKIYGEKKIGFHFDPAMTGDFFSLSSSEQYELLEEFFAHFVYVDDRFPDDIEVVSVENHQIIFNYEIEDLNRLIKEKLKL